MVTKADVTIKDCKFNNLNYRINPHKQWDNYNIVLLNIESKYLC